MSNEVSLYARPAWTNWVPTVFAALAAATALATASAMPTSVTTAVEIDGHLTPVGTHVNAWSIAFVASQILAVCAACGGAILGRLGRVEPAKRALEVAVVAGLVPAVVPGILALIARLLTGTSASRPGTA